MTKNNQDQIDYWNGVVGERWVSHQSMIDTMMAPFSAALLNKLDISAGQHIIDIGCGCGDISEQVARLGARVTGIDISEPMLAQARKQSTEGVTYERVDAETGQLPDNHFDYAISRFGVMFFNTPIKAFINIKRALKPTGKLVFVCWRHAKDNPWVAIPGSAIAPLLPKPAATDPAAPGPFAFADPKRISRILTSAGFGAVRIEPFEANMPIAVGQGVLAAVDYISKIGPTARAIAELDDEKRAVVRERLRIALGNSEVNSTVHLGGAVWLVSAEV